LLLVCFSSCFTVWDVSEWRWTFLLENAVMWSSFLLLLLLLLVSHIPKWCSIKLPLDSSDNKLAFWPAPIWSCQSSTIVENKGEPEVVVAS
jgi:hypothetical protein